MYTVLERSSRFWDFLLMIKSNRDRKILRYHELSGGRTQAMSTFVGSHMFYRNHKFRPWSYTANEFGTVWLSSRPVWGGFQKRVTPLWMSPKRGTSIRQRIVPSLKWIISRKSCVKRKRRIAHRVRKKLNRKAVMMTLYTPVTLWQEFSYLNSQTHLYREINEK